jgi:short-subunit dehydrogenase
MSTFNNAIVLITGGASGIGKLMGKLSLERNAQKLIIWDINEKLIEQTKKEFSEFASRVTFMNVDITNVKAIQSAAQEVLTNFGSIDILINNAGIVIGKYFHEHSHTDIEKIMNLNVNGQLHVTRAFLPSMVEKNSGHIVNIASAGGMVGNPKMSTYVSSKWALIGWSDSLRLEMEKLHKSIRVLCITPYYISTGMFDGVKSNFILPITQPEKAARLIIRGIENNRLYVRMPLIVYALQFVKGILPIRWFDFIVGTLLGVYKTMDEFTGRK